MYDYTPPVPTHRPIPAIIEEKVNCKQPQHFKTYQEAKDASKNGGLVIEDMVLGGYTVICAREENTRV